MCSLGPLRITESNEIELLIYKLRKSFEIVDSLVYSSANVILDYAQNSVLQASGDIMIQGQGSIIFELEAGGKILIQEGIVRSGKATAMEIIKIK